MLSQEPLCILFLGSSMVDECGVVYNRRRLLQRQIYHTFNVHRVYLYNLQSPTTTAHHRGGDYHHMNTTAATHTVSRKHGSTTDSTPLLHPVIMDNDTKATTSSGNFNPALVQPTTRMNLSQMDPGPSTIPDIDFDSIQSMSELKFSSLMQTSTPQYFTTKKDVDAIRGTFTAEQRRSLYNLYLKSLCLKRFYCPKCSQLCLADFWHQHECSPKSKFVCIWCEIVVWYSKFVPRWYKAHHMTGCADKFIRRCMTLAPINKHNTNIVCGTSIESTIAGGERLVESDTHPPSVMNDDDTTQNQTSCEVECSILEIFNRIVSLEARLGEKKNTEFETRIEDLNTAHRVREEQLTMNNKMLKRQNTRLKRRISFIKKKNEIVVRHLCDILRRAQGPSKNLAVKRDKIPSGEAGPSNVAVKPEKIKIPPSCTPSVAIPSAKDVSRFEHVFFDIRKSLPQKRKVQ